jgi:hypothetical protein
MIPPPNGLSSYRFLGILTHRSAVDNKDWTEVSGLEEEQGNSVRGGISSAMAPVELATPYGCGALFLASRLNLFSSCFFWRKISLFLFALL